MLGVLLAPAAAMAEGPGYGGTADAVSVQWQAGADRAEGLAVYAVGFRSASSVTLRVGAAADRTVYADAAGALQVLVVRGADLAGADSSPGMTVLSVDMGTAGRLSPGMSVQLVGPNPAGGTRTLVGAVPPPPAGNGVQDAAPWVALAVVTAVLMGSGLLTRLPGAARLAPTVRRYQHPARHRIPKGFHLAGEGSGPQA